MEDRSEILLKDVNQAIHRLGEKEESFDLILMDPPYEKGLVQETLKKLEVKRIYHNDSILVIEHSPREPLPDISETWNLIRQRRIGDTVLSLITPFIQEPSLDQSGTEKRRTS